MHLQAVLLQQTGKESSNATLEHATLEDRNMPHHQLLLWADFNGIVIAIVWLPRRGMLCSA